MRWVLLLAVVLGYAVGLCGGDRVFRVGGGQVCDAAADGSADVPCCSVPVEFRSCETLNCEELDNSVDLRSSDGTVVITCNENVSYGMRGCVGYEAGDRGFHICSAVEGLECTGKRVWAERLPCRRWSGIYFHDALYCSLLLGWFGIDRLHMGLTLSGTFKLLTLGGLGIWWFLDIVLLLTGHLVPNDGDWQV